ncbi:MAG: hypothetical protein WDN45_12330 [Caulobacteraceae bacterium]
MVYWEEPVATAGPREGVHLDARVCPKSGVIIATPVLPDTLQGAKRETALKGLLDGFIAAREDRAPDPLVLYADDARLLGPHRRVGGGLRLHGRAFQLQVRAAGTAPAGAGPDGSGRCRLHRRLQPLRGQAGPAPQHPPFPSSVDRAHFAQARDWTGEEPQDQARLPHPRLGFYGVVDERMDLELLVHIADARPECGSW